MEYDPAPQAAGFDPGPCLPDASCGGRLAAIRRPAECCDLADRRGARAPGFAAACACGGNAAGTASLAAAAALVSSRAALCGASPVCG
jgi:hypothetical protein